MKSAKEFNYISWYATKIIAENGEVFQPHISAPIWTNAARLAVIKEIRLNFFAEKECEMLAKELIQEKCNTKEAFRLAHAVFVEAETEEILGLLFDKLKERCAKMNVEEMTSYIKMITQNLGKARTGHLAMGTLDFYEDNFIWRN